MARDARVGRDRVLVENYFQHAEHYQRLANEILEAQSQAAEAAQNSGRRPNGGADNATPERQTPANADAVVDSEPKESEAATVNGSGQDAPDESKPPTRRRRAPRTPQPQPEVKTEADAAEVVEAAEAAEAVEVVEVTPDQVEVSSDQEDVPSAEVEAAS